MEQNKIILYQDDDEITRVAVRFADEDLWLTKNQLAEIYCTSRENITMHIKNIYADEELMPDSTSKDFLLVREEGSRQVKRNVAHKRKVLTGKGTVSHAQAIKKAEREFEIYRQREMEMLESDFDREVKKFKENN